ncbi:lipopolysaccharide biosynthesis protein [Methylocystis sp. IM3]|uniref:lipopolysaccharide biosynthesis protein n=1 Tax=unclassified Methylocystis TaxID=2625913 RepID=UPI0030F7DFC5
MATPFLLNSLLNFAIGLMVAKALGPSEYGRFMLALAVAIVLQTLLFDWLRLAATRFYSARDRDERPEIRATLDASFAALAAFAILLALAIAFFRPRLPLDPGLAALAVGVSLTNALFDFAAALLRARFHTAAYGRLVIAKNGLALLATVGGAFLFGSAKAALVGMMISVLAALAASRRHLIDPGASLHKAERVLLARLLAYGLPIILAAALYQSVPLANRALLAHSGGFAEVGLLSLAFETGVRIVGAVGSAIDAILFQIAVHRERTDGAGAARAQIADNLGAVFALLLPAVAGAWLILPSFEALFAPRAFQGAFAAYFTLTAPALFAFGMVNYGVNTAFQLAQRLRPLVIAALVAVFANFLALALLPASPGAARFAVAQSVSSMSGLAVLVAMLFVLEPMWPRARDILGALAATGVMLAAGLPLRALPPGASTLALQLVAGAGLYGALAFAFDIAGFRAMVKRSA